MAGKIADVFEDYVEANYFWSPQPSPSRVVLRRKLGEGNFGKVFEAEWEGKETIAVKIIKTDGKQNAQADVDREVAALEYFTSSDVTPVFHFHKRTDNYDIIALELLGESLSDWRKKGPIMPPAAIKLVGVKVAAALKIMHSNGWIHGDIKPANICFDRKDNTNLKLADLGSCMPLATLRAKPVLFGSIYYNSPEAFVGSDFDYSVDIWALGCTMAELLNGTFLFDVQYEGELYKIFEQWQLLPPNPRSGVFFHYIRDDLPKRQMPAGLEPTFKKHLENIEQPDSWTPEEKRGTVQDLLSLMNPVPSQRPTAAQVEKGWNRAY